ncbi:MAG: AmmeMemoRadiSam system protein B [Bacteroidota bacterium]
MSKRKAAVEGRFYPSSKRKIFDQIREIESAARYPEADIRPESIYGAVLPHAGHIYSGPQTIPFFQLLRKQEKFPATFVIVHPNHTGQGLPLAVDDAHMWVNDVGEVPLDREFALEMGLPFDGKAHAREHAAEVIIPYLQYYLEDHFFSIVPVCMGNQGYDQAVLVAEKIHETATRTGREIMVLASCDFSHFLPPGEGRKKDQYVVDEILARNPKGVEDAVNDHRVSVCGYGPIMALMSYTAMINPGYLIRILARGNSGDVSPSPEVVDYISMILYRC